MSDITDRIDKIDRILFDASVIVISANSRSQRTAADNKIMDARVELDKLRSRFR